MVLPSCTHTTTKLPPRPGTAFTQAVAAYASALAADPADTPAPAPAYAEAGAAAPPPSAEPATDVQFELLARHAAGWRHDPEALTRLLRPGGYSPVRAAQRSAAAALCNDAIVRRSAARCHAARWGVPAQDLV